MTLPSFIINQFAEYNQQVNEHSVQDNTASTVPVEFVTFPQDAFGQHHFSGDEQYLSTWLQKKYKIVNAGVNGVLNRTLAGNGYLENILALLAVQNSMTQPTLEAFLSAYDYKELPVDDFIEPFFLEMREFVQTWHIGYFNILGEKELLVSDAPFSVLNITILGTEMEVIYVPISPKNFILVTRSHRDNELFRGHLTPDDLNTITIHSAHDYVYSSTNIDTLQNTSEPYYEYESHKHIGLSTDAFRTFNKIKNSKFPHLDIPDL